ncbi:FecCD family ABC transporter permease [Paenibacillus hodogayensis]|uniref:FecCD family ABC transporter permease n=1 Tax=Paenibacillus hodogayensis TaxID=279208 RepID=A0ABV5VZX4_9BACL
MDRFKLRANGFKTAGLAASAAMLLLCLAASVMLGATNYSWGTAWQAMFHYNEAMPEQIVIRTTRVPRALIAAAVGASLAVAGALMQAMTRNPLAAPSVLGINASATFFLVAAALVFSVDGLYPLLAVSFLGASVGAALVYVLGAMGRDGLTPLKIILAGSAITALFSSFTQTLLVLNKQGLNTVLFWLTGSIAGRSPDLIMAVLPFMLAGWIAAVLLAKDMNLLMIGEETAKGMGQRIVFVKAAIGILIVMLAGGSVSVAGPIGFIGIVIPHIARHIVGVDNRWVIPYSALLGAILLIVADLAARFVMVPEEIPVGVMTAVVGAPFYIYIARRGIGK